MAEIKKVDINGALIPILVNNRALVEYAREKGRSTVDGLEDALLISYYGLKSGARSLKLEFKMSFEEWIDYTDEHPEIMQEDKNEIKADDPDADKKKATT